MSPSLREPILHPTPILSLRPTQMTLGMTEVHRKRAAWNKKTSVDLAKFLAAHMVPVITGLEGEPYLIDHHHLARALYEEGVKSVFVTVVADLSRLPVEHFWNMMMSFHSWVHPYDSKGRRCPYSELPKTVKTMEDDPYRSLAGELRNLGGFAKDSSPFYGIPVGRFLKAAHQGEGDQGRLRRGVDQGDDPRQDRGSGLPARLVRAARLRRAIVRQGQDSNRQAVKRKTRQHDRHCERSDAIQGVSGPPTLRRRVRVLGAWGSETPPSAAGPPPRHRERSDAIQGEREPAARTTSERARPWAPGAARRRPSAVRPPRNAIRTFGDSLPNPQLSAVH